MLYSEKVLCKSPAEGFGVDGDPWQSCDQGHQHDYEVVTVVGLAWTPKVVQLETQDADAGQLVSFGLDRPNQRDAAAEADVNALNVASLLLRPHRTAGPRKLCCWKSLFFCSTTQPNTSCHITCRTGKPLSLNH